MSTPGILSLFVGLISNVLEDFFLELLVVTICFLCFLAVFSRRAKAGMEKTYYEPLVASFAAGRRSPTTAGHSEKSATTK
jgi:hypothetical protein